MIYQNPGLLKAKKDPFFSAVIKHYGIEHLESAGFFDDGASPDIDMAEALDLGLLTTPLDKIINRIKALNFQCDNKLAVLVSSGGFCPIHSGHLAMMDSAKNELESRGYFVLGGYVTPDHDQYIRQKCGDKGIDTATRLHLAELATEKSDWLSVDPWAARYLDRAINYTDIVRRLNNYLKFHLGFDLEVFFVCGADNAQFSKAFIESNGILIVPRLGQVKEIQLPTEIGEKVFICNSHDANNFSSRNIRAGDTEAVPEQLKSLKLQPDYSKVSIYLRDEGSWSIENWLEKYGDRLVGAKRSFDSKIEKLLLDCFSSAYHKAEVSLERVALSTQQSLCKRELDKLGLKTISLDSCIAADINIGLSRLFEVTSSKRLQGLFPRPGAKNIAEQISHIPEGEYCLMEDDIATGETIREFMRLLPQQVKIKKIISVNELKSGKKLQTIEAGNSKELSDAGDLRDFLVGARDGGLVVSLPNGEVARVPYLLPYVKNTTRMSLPISKELEFSKKAWRYNLEFFQSLPCRIKVEDCPESFQILARYLGFKTDQSLEEFCRWHLDLLNSSQA